MSELCWPGGVWGALECPTRMQYWFVDHPIHVMKKNWQLGYVAQGLGGHPCVGNCVFLQVVVGASSLDAGAPAFTPAVITGASAFTLI